MRSLLIDLWIRLQASYWFLPLCMVASAAALGWAMVMIDERVPRELILAQPWLFTNQAEGARSLLSTVAGSMITVAGVTFSMTLVMLSHASSVIGHRLITGFMRDRGNQVTLGTFVATFMYCLLVLRTIRGPAEGVASEAFIPHLSIVVGLILAMVSVMVLIYFVHHVPHELNMSNVVNRVGAELMKRLDDLYPSEVGSAQASSPHDMPPDFETAAARIGLKGDGGYLRVLDGDGLISLAKEHDLLLGMTIAPGQFASPGMTLIRAYPAQNMSDKVVSQAQQLFSWGAERTPEQDALFLVDQLCEVAGRALSPGICDPYTAFACIDQLERVVASLKDRSLPNRYRYDDAGTLRVIASRIEFVDFVDRMMIPMREFVSTDSLASRHLMRMIARLGDLELNSDISSRLLAHADALMDQAQTHINDETTIGALRELHQQARDALATPQPFGT